MAHRLIGFKVAWADVRPPLNPSKGEVGALLDVWGDLRYYVTWTGEEWARLGRRDGER